MPAKIIGYKCCNRGLNNQKLSLLGLVALCNAQNSVLSIPKIADFNPNTSKPEREHEFANIFEATTFSRYLQRLGVKHTAESCDNLDVEEAFQLGNKQKIGNRVAFLSALQPCKQLNDFINDVAFKAYPTIPKVALQLRIERDWIRYSRVRLAGKPRENNLLSAFEILDKLAISVRCSSLYVTCDEASLSAEKEDICRYAKDKYSIRIIWKSNIQQEKLTFAAATEFDFHLARMAGIFVGTSRSTFANLLCSASPRAKHFLYNRDRSELVRRTDKGMHADAMAATVTWTKRLRHRFLHTINHFSRPPFNSEQSGSIRKPSHSSDVQ